MNKTLILFLLLIVVILYPLASEAKDPKLKEIPTDTVEYANKKLQYAYYMPKTSENPTEALILVPGLSGKGQGMINKEWKKLADEKKWLIIAPTFVFEGGNAFDNRKSYQYPKAWSGKALNTIFSKFAEDKGIRIDSLYMVGFSAGAQFVGRYIFLYSEKVKKAAIISSGGNDPIQKRISVEIFYGIGEKDTKVRKDNAEKFIREAQNIGILITEKTYPKTGHKFTKTMQADVIEFIR